MPVPSLYNVSINMWRMFFISVVLLFFVKLASLLVSSFPAMLQDIVHHYSYDLTGVHTCIPQWSSCSAWDC